MTPLDALTSPLTIFTGMVAVGWLLYLWSRRVAPPFHAEGSKARAYTGGEDLPGRAYRPGYEFFHIALFFTLLHVGAIVVATAPRDAVPWAAMGYLGLLGVSILVLRWEP